MSGNRRVRQGAVWPAMLLAAAGLLTFYRVGLGLPASSNPTRAAATPEAEARTADLHWRPENGSASAPPPAGHPPNTTTTTTQPAHKFLLFFSGHQGSSALADMLGSLPEVFVPGFEPLDFPGISPAQKLAFLEATFSFPATAAHFPAWRRQLAPVPGRRLDRAHLASYPQLSGKTVAGFKLRPYLLQPAGGDSEANDGSGGQPSSSSQGHTALSGGMRPSALKALLGRHGVSVLLTLRRDPLREALSWHRARDLGLKQFSAVLGRPWRNGTAGERSGVQQQQQQGEQQASRAPPLGDAAGRLRANASQVLQWLDYTAAVNRGLRQAAAYYARPTLTVWYEDFLADPLGQAARAASFVGADPRHLRPSKFRKVSASDSPPDWVANYGELCVALQGTQHSVHLNATACRRALASRTAAHAGNATAAAAVAAASATKQNASGTNASTPGKPASLPPTVLLDDWCAARDAAAAGWGALSQGECQRRFLAQRAAVVQAVRNGSGTLLFKHVHKAGGSTLCQLAQRNMVAEAPHLPHRGDWDTNCVPYQAFLGPHPAVGSHPKPWAALALNPGNKSSSSGSGSSAGSGRQQQQQQQHRRQLQGLWLGGACWLGWLSPAQLRVLPHHFRPLTFVASEGPLPDLLPLDIPFAMMTMLRHPYNRLLSSYRWWRLMSERWPHAPAECRAYDAPPNATLAQWVAAYPSSWMTRELVGRTALYRRGADGHLPPLTCADLRLAQQRLHYNAAVLLLERPASSMSLLRAAFGWREVGWAEHRAGSRLSGGGGIGGGGNSTSAMAELAAAGVLREVQRRHALDLELYAYAEALHAQQLHSWGLAASAAYSVQT